MTGNVFWITGLSGSGKTTIGTALYYALKKNVRQCVLLDGDVIKKLFGVDNIDYSVQGRRKRAYQYSELCKLLSDQGIIVICCTIAMFDEVREWNRRHISKYYEIYIEIDFDTVAARDSKGLYQEYSGGSQAMVGIDDNYELPKNPNIIIRNTMDNQIDRYVDSILSLQGACLNHKTTDNDYWNSYYKNEPTINYPSGFAEFALDYMEKGKKLIDLGCGNGRDSVFFHNNGLKVTSVDRSFEAINLLNGKESAIFAVCDDFIRAKPLFCVDYHYCYARWIIHSINLSEQEELFSNVYNALHKEGLFFIEARTVNDNKYGKGQELGPDEYLFDGHYRRFLCINRLEESLQNAGFTILYIEESNAFSVVKDDAPMLVRVVAQKHVGTVKHN